jgi:formaldehyde-activating enzyme involved in methanogenesis
MKEFIWYLKAALSGPFARPTVSDIIKPLTMIVKNLEISIKSSGEKILGNQNTISKLQAENMEISLEAQKAEKILKNLEKLLDV